MLRIIIDVLIVVGAFFALAGTIGVMKMPDTFSRMQASTCITTMGVIGVCLGTACYVKGSQAVLDRLSEELKVPVGKTTADGKFTLNATRCLGACGLAPVMVVNGQVYGKMTPAKAVEVINEYKARG